MTATLSSSDEMRTAWDGNRVRRTFWVTKGRLRNRAVQMRGLGYALVAAYRSQGPFRGAFAVLVFEKDYGRS